MYIISEVINELLVNCLEEKAEKYLALVAEPQ